MKNNFSSQIEESKKEIFNECYKLVTSRSNYNQNQVFKNLTQQMKNENKILKNILKDNLILKNNKKKLLKIVNLKEFKKGSFETKITNNFENEKIMKKDNEPKQNEKKNNNKLIKQQIKCQEAKKQLENTGNKYFIQPVGVFKPLHFPPNFHQPPFLKQEPLVFQTSQNNKENSKNYESFIKLKNNNQENYLIKPNFIESNFNKEQIVKHKQISLLKDNKKYYQKAKEEPNLLQNRNSKNTSLQNNYTFRRFLQKDGKFFNFSQNNNLMRDTKIKNKKIIKAFFSDSDSEEDKSKNLTDTSSTVDTNSDYYYYSQFNKNKNKNIEKKTKTKKDKKTSDDSHSYSLKSKKSSYKNCSKNAKQKNDTNKTKAKSKKKLDKKRSSSYKLKSIWSSSNNNTSGLQNDSAINEFTDQGENNGITDQERFPPPPLPPPLSSFLKSQYSLPKHSSTKHSNLKNQISKTVADEKCGNVNMCCDEKEILMQCCKLKCCPINQPQEMKVKCCSVDAKTNSKDKTNQCMCLFKSGCGCICPEPNKEEKKDKFSKIQNSVNKPLPCNCSGCGCACFLPEPKKQKSFYCCCLKCNQEINNEKNLDSKKIAKSLRNKLHKRKLYKSAKKRFGMNPKETSHSKTGSIKSNFSKFNVSNQFNQNSRNYNAISSILGLDEKKLDDKGGSVFCCCVSCSDESSEFEDSEEKFEELTIERPLVCCPPMSQENPFKTKPLCCFPCGCNIRNGNNSKNVLPFDFFQCCNSISNPVVNSWEESIVTNELKPNEVSLKNSKLTNNPSMLSLNTTRELQSKSHIQERLQNQKNGKILNFSLKKNPNKLNFSQSNGVKPPHLYPRGNQLIPVLYEQQKKKIESQKDFLSNNFDHNNFHFEKQEKNSNSNPLRIYQRSQEDQQIETDNYNQNFLQLQQKKYLQNQKNWLKQKEIDVMKSSQGSRHIMQEFPFQKNLCTIKNFSDKEAIINGFNGFSPNHKANFLQQNSFFCSY